MANLQKVMKVTQAQYNTLASGGTVGTYTGLNDNYIYLVEDPLEKLPLITYDDSTTLEDLPLDSFALREKGGGEKDTWICTKNYCLLPNPTRNGISFIAHNATQYCSGTCGLNEMSTLLISDIFRGTEDNFTITTYSVPDATTDQKGVVEIMTDEEMDAQTGGTSPTASVNPIVDLIYPVGAIYMSRDSSFNPSVAFPGTTWSSRKTIYLEESATRAISGDGWFTLDVPQGTPSSSNGNILYYTANGHPNVPVTSGTGDMYYESGLKNASLSYYVYIWERTA